MSQAPTRRLHAESFACGLHERTLGGLVDLGPGSARFLLVATGEVVVAGPAGDVALRGPALGWFPDAPAQRLRARAGSAGRTLVLSDLALAAATHHAAEGARGIARRRVVHALTGAPDLRADVEHAFAVILREAAGARPGADSLIEAQVGILLVLLWRHAGAAPEARGAVPEPLLADFRRLLELHFRDRWSVARYAARLGVSSDLLHDRCTRRLGRSPSRLIRERVMQEAQALLAQTPLSAARIAADLGFDQPAHFSRVFSAATGLSPGRWRARARAAAGETGGDRSFADWP